jgi:hypothetical protein
VVLALAVLSLLVAGVARAALDASRSDQSVESAALALAAAERALARTLSPAVWDPRWQQASMRTVLVRQGSVGSDGTVDSVTVIRIASVQWLVVADGFSPGIRDPARHRIRALIVLDTAGRARVADRGWASAW